MQRKEVEQQRIRDAEHEAYNLILKDTDEALAGRSWLILMILMTAVFHAYAKRNELHTDSDVEDFDMLRLIDEITDHLKKQKDEDEEKKEEIIEALQVTRKSRNLLGHNQKYFQLTEIIEWTDSWTSSAEYLLANTQRNEKQVLQDGRRIKQLKKACDALKCPGRRDQSIKNAFRFALADTSYAKAARAYFIQTTVVHPALKECAALHVFRRGQEENKDIPELLNLLFNKKTTFLQGRDTFYIEKLFFGKDLGHSPHDVDGDGIKEIRNILAHNTSCSTRRDIKYIEILSLWKQLLTELNSCSKYKQMLDKAENYLC